MQNNYYYAIVLQEMFVFKIPKSDGMPKDRQ